MQRDMQEQDCLWQVVHNRVSQKIWSIFDQKNFFLNTVKTKNTLHCNDTNFKEISNNTFCLEKSHLLVLAFECRILLEFKIWAKFDVSLLAMWLTASVCVMTAISFLQCKTPELFKAQLLYKFAWLLRPPKCKSQANLHEFLFYSEM